MRHMPDLETLSFALDLVGDGILILKPDRSIEYCNSGFARRAMVDPAAVVGSSLNCLYDSQHLGADIGRRLDEVLANNLSGRHFLRGRDGREVYVECHSRADGAWTILAGELGSPGSAGRKALLDFVGTLIIEARPATVLYLDLDRFKVVNDTLGHDAGDALLLIVVTRIQSALGADDRLVRLGGDEFGVVHNGDAESAETLANTLIKLVSGPSLISGHVVQVGLSVGVAEAYTDGTEPAGLLRAADLALYAAKAAGRGCAKRFNIAMDEALAIRRSLEYDLRKAEKLREFRLHYQPQASVTGGVSSCEALIRWQHPTRGLVPPDQFLPVAETIGLMSNIGNWVLRTACKEASSWPAHINVAVNISPSQFASGKLVDQVRDALASSSLPANRLEIEITETVLLNNTEDNLATLFALRALGVRLAMDDFGTGYSSLSYLTRFPFDTLKVDRSFVMQMGTDASSAAIVSAVADIGNRLGIMTIAEGVETTEQLEAVRACGFTATQGYLFSRPLSADDLKASMAIWANEAATAHQAKAAA